MSSIKHKLYEVLNMIKGFEVGHTSRVANKLIIDYKDKRYVVVLKEIENPSNHMLEDMDTYL